VFGTLAVLIAALRPLAAELFKREARTTAWRRASSPVADRWSHRVALPAVAAPMPLERST
jgi:hypothetical protein